MLYEVITNEATRWYAFELRYKEELDYCSPSSDPVMMMGSSGWKLTQETFWAWPSRVWTQVLFYNTQGKAGETFMDPHKDNAADQ